MAAIIISFTFEALSKMERSDGDVVIVYDIRKVN